MKFVLRIAIFFCLTNQNSVDGRVYSVFCQPNIDKLLEDQAIRSQNNKNSVKIKHQNICSYSEYIQKLLIDIRKNEVTDVVGPLNYQNYELCSSIDNIMEDLFINNYLKKRKSFLNYKNLVCQNEKITTQVNAGSVLERKMGFENVRNIEGFKQERKVLQNLKDQKSRYWDQNYFRANGDFREMSQITANLLSKFRWMSVIIVSSYFLRCGKKVLHCFNMNFTHSYDHFTHFPPTRSVLPRLLKNDFRILATKKCQSTWNDQSR